MNHAVNYHGKTFGSAEGETVLDTLVREGQDVIFGCKAGVCQSCVMRCEEGDLPSTAQKGLNEAQKALNYFLPCQCHPQGPLKVAKLDQQRSIVTAKVKNKVWLNAQVIRLQLDTELEFRAGQFITLWNDHSIGRSYSISSLPSEGIVECHIKVIENGVFSQWVKDQLKAGQTLGIQGPYGLCFYQGKPEQQLLLAAIGTGLSPILGVLKDALANRHHGTIDVVIGAKQISGFYMLDTLRQLARHHPNINLHFVCQHEAQHPIVSGDIYHYISERFKDLKDRRIFLCGAASFVEKAKKLAFMNGAAISEIHADGFIAS